MQFQLHCNGECIDKINNSEKIPFHLVEVQRETRDSSKNRKMFSGEKFGYCTAIVIFVCIFIPLTHVSSAHQIEFSKQWQIYFPIYFVINFLLASLSHHTREKVHFRFCWQRISRSLVVVVFIRISMKYRRD